MGYREELRVVAVDTAVRARLAQSARAHVPAMPEYPQQDCPSYDSFNRNHIARVMESRLDAPTADRLMPDRIVRGDTRKLSKRQLRRRRQAARKAAWREMELSAVHLTRLYQRDLIESLLDQLER